MRALSYWLVVAGIAAFQASLLPYFESDLAAAPGWRTAYYVFWLLVVSTAAAAFVIDPDTRRRAALPATAFTACAALVLLHPIDQIAKNYLVAMGLMATNVVLAIHSRKENDLLRLAAIVTAVNAALCLVDVLTDGLTNTPGRAAGLSTNPNIAAASILAGTVLTMLAVPPRWQPSFVALAGAAIFVTLSRSTLLIGVFALCAGLVTVVRRDGNVARRLLAAIPAVVLLVLWIAVALSTNPRFALTTELSFGSAQQVTRSIQIAWNAIRPGEPSSDGTSPQPDIESRSERIAELGRRARELGMEDSASARSVLLQRSLLAYRTAPILGLGLADAHALSPHNTYLLFAVAFGLLGWLVAPGLLALFAYYRAWTASATLAGLLLFSHDLMLLPATTILFAVGLAALIPAGPSAAPRHRNKPHDHVTPIAWMNQRNG